MELEKIFDGIAVTPRLYRLINRYAKGSPHASLGYKAGQYFEIGQEDYWSFYGMMPPLSFTGESFAMAEFTMGNLTDSFHRIADRYFCVTIAYQGIATVREAAAALAEATKES